MTFEIYQSLKKSFNCNFSHFTPISECGCNQYGSLSEDCADGTGNCQCKTGHGGLKCDTCKTGYVKKINRCCKKSPATYENDEGECNGKTLNHFTLC